MKMWTISRVDCRHLRRPTKNKKIVRRHCDGRRSILGKMIRFPQSKWFCAEKSKRTPSAHNRAILSWMIHSSFVKITSDRDIANWRLDQRYRSHSRSWHSIRSNEWNEKYWQMLFVVIAYSVPSICTFWKCALIELIFISRPLLHVSNSRSHTRTHRICERTICASHLTESRFLISS